MTVECPRCGTRYRRPAEAGHGTFRCARCRHVFEAQRDEPAFVTDDEPTAIGDDREEDFILDDPLEADEPPPRRRPTEQ